MYARLRRGSRTLLQERYKERTTSKQLHSEINDCLMAPSKNSCEVGFLPAQDRLLTRGLTNLSVKSEIAGFGDFCAATHQKNKKIVKQQLLTKVLTATAIAFSSMTVAVAPSYGQTSPRQTGFWCRTSTGVPATVYQNSQGAIEPWIEWTSDYFSGSGYDPITRCQLVSQRLEIYRRNRELKYITAGRMNGQNVICTADRINGVCQNLIYTLRPGQDPIDSLYNLLAWRQGQVGMPSAEESGQIPYIYVGDKLGENTVEEAQLPPFSPPEEQP